MCFDDPIWILFCRTPHLFEHFSKHFCNIKALIRSLNCRFITIAVFLSNSMLKKNKAWCISRTVYWWLVSFPLYPQERDHLEVRWSSLEKTSYLQERRNPDCLLVVYVQILAEQLYRADVNLYHRITADRVLQHLLEG